jgi:transcriptional regulator with XRE-family HTH domain
MTSTERHWYTILGGSLRFNRAAKGMTIYDVAAITGTSGVSVSRWERGLQRMAAYHYDLLRQAGLLND